MDIDIIIQHITQAMNGYSKNDTVPISGSLLFDICELAKEYEKLKKAYVVELIKHNSDPCTIGGWTINDKGEINSETICK
jgi:hypothetical protein